MDNLKKVIALNRKLAREIKRNEDLPKWFRKTLMERLKLNHRDLGFFRKAGKFK